MCLKRMAMNFMFVLQMKALNYKRLHLWRRLTNRVIRKN
jgi:hypothetical protein